MILKKAFEKHGRTATYNSNFYYANGSMHLISKDVKKFLKEQGFAITDGQWKTLIIRKGDAPAKIHWNSGVDTYPRKSISLLVKTPNGGWKEQERNNNFEPLIAKAEAFKAPQKVTKKTLPKPVKIGVEKEFTPSLRGSAVQSVNLKWRSVSVKQVVGLDDSGVVDQSKIYSPHETPWFLVMITDFNGAARHIITDGEVLHPLRNAQVNKQHKFKVDYKSLPLYAETTPQDKLLLESTIEIFFENMK